MKEFRDVLLDFKESGKFIVAMENTIQKVDITLVLWLMKFISILGRWNLMDLLQKSCLQGDV